MLGIDVDYIFSPSEHNALHDILSKIKSNPYSEYELFEKEISSIATSQNIPDIFKDICFIAKERDSFYKPYIYLKNCPIDNDKPLFDFKSPVESKYKLKKTFVAEAFLCLFSTLNKMHIVRYGLMNNGDAFHDIYPMEDLSNSLSQKSLISLGHHQDFPIHFARPRWVHMVSLRNPQQNDVYTTFVRNLDIINSLDHETIKVIESSIFFTPYDDVTKHGDKGRSLNDADGTQKPIKINNMLMYYEGRTKSSSLEGISALKALNTAIQNNTKNLKLEDGEFISFDNETCLHGRNVLNVSDPEAHKTRWLMKTHCLGSLNHLKDRFMLGNNGVING